MLIKDVCLSVLYDMEADVIVGRETQVTSWGIYFHLQDSLSYLLSIF